MRSTLCPVEYMDLFVLLVVRGLGVAITLLDLTWRTYRFVTWLKRDAVKESKASHLFESVTSGQAHDFTFEENTLEGLLD